MKMLSLQWSFADRFLLFLYGMFFSDPPRTPQKYNTYRFVAPIIMRWSGAMDLVALFLRDLIEERLQEASISTQQRKAHVRLSKAQIDPPTY